MGTSLNIQAWSIAAASNDGADSTIGAVADTSAPDAVDNWTRGVMASVKRHSLDIGGGVAAVGGTANAITITTNQVISSAHEAAGFSIRFKAASTNTGATTVAVDGLSAQAVERMDGTALSAGDIVAGGIYDLAYNATNAGYTLMTGVNVSNFVLLSGNNAFTGTNTFSVAPRPSANDAAALGVSGTAWADLFLASGAVINFDAGDVTLTHSANTLTVAGGALAAASVTITGGSIAGITDLAVADGGTGASNAATARTNLGLGSIATVDSPVPVANGGTASTTAAGARTALGLGTAATQNTGTSGGTVPLLNTGCTWDNSFTQTFNGPVIIGNNGLTVSSGAGFAAASFSDDVTINATLTGEDAIFDKVNTFCLSLGRLGTNGDILRFLGDTNPSGSVSVNLGTGTVAYNTSSDGRLKDGVVKLSYSGRVLDDLEPVEFTWKRNGGRDVGFIAQDLIKVAPNAVTEGNGEPGEEGFRPWQADYGKLMPFVVAEIKGLRARVAELEARERRH